MGGEGKIRKVHQGFGEWWTVVAKGDLSFGYQSIPNRWPWRLSGLSEGIFAEKKKKKYKKKKKKKKKKNAQKFSRLINNVS